MEGDFIRINRWLTPLSWLYGLGVYLRNELFDLHILKSKSYPIPVINIGNITVGGTGKTPHTEYLIHLLQKNYKVAVLSRGYKRKSKGFVLATPDTPMEQLGDEPYQMKQKFPHVEVAVDRNRRHGIEQIIKLVPEVDVILLDDAYQHRYVKPGINILLTDYHRLICEDCLLPAGRLREPAEGKRRANIVVVSKCPNDIKPINFRVIRKALNLYPYQKLFFSTLHYGALHPVFSGTPDRPLAEIAPEEKILLVTGIASPQQILFDLERFTQQITHISYGDHHYFSPTDVAHINQTFADLGEHAIVVTTEKDSVRLRNLSGLSEGVRQHLYTLPVEIEFLQDTEYSFNDKIIDYVRKNSKNSILVKR